MTHISSTDTRQKRLLDQRPFLLSGNKGAENVWSNAQSSPMTCSQPTPVDAFASVASSQSPISTLYAGPMKFRKHCTPLFLPICSCTPLESHILTKSSPPFVHHMAGRTCANMCEAFQSHVKKIIPRPVMHTVILPCCNFKTCQSLQYLVTVPISLGVWALHCFFLNQRNRNLHIGH